MQAAAAMDVVRKATTLLLLTTAASAQRPLTASKMKYGKCGTSELQDFDFPSSGSTGTITSSDGRCLSVKDCLTTADHGVVVLAECGPGTCDGKHQLWSAKPVPGKADGTVYLKSELTPEKSFCLNVPQDTAWGAELAVWSGLPVGGQAGCAPIPGEDVSNQYFTPKSGQLQTDPVCRHSPVLATCEPDCCIESEPCTPPACVWSYVCQAPTVACDVCVQF
jgi:hypothetical protein